MRLRASPAIAACCTCSLRTCTHRRFNSMNKCLMNPTAVGRKYVCLARDCRLLPLQLSHLRKGKDGTPLNSDTAA